MTDASTSVNVLPFYQLAEPYILTAFGIIFSALMTWALAQFQTRTGIHVSDQAKAAVQTAATNAAGRILAAQEGNVANIKFDVHSPLIAAEVPKLIASVGPQINQLGMTPDRVRDLIQARLGLVQASATPAVSAAPTTPSTPAQ